MIEKLLNQRNIILAKFLFWLSAISILMSVIILIDLLSADPKAPDNIGILGTVVMLLFSPTVFLLAIFLRKREKNLYKKAIDKLQEFNPDTIIVNRFNGLAKDDNSKLIVIAKREHGKITVQKKEFRDLRKVATYYDTYEAKKKTGSEPSLTGAIVGGLAYGPLGAVLGSSFASKNTHEKESHVTAIGLHFNFWTTESKIVIYTFWNSYSLENTSMKKKNVVNEYYKLFAEITDKYYDPERLRKMHK
jgi:hypothetical protein